MKSFWAKSKGKEEDSKVDVAHWLEEDSEEAKPHKHRAITPAALELFGDAVVANQPPPRCQSSLGAVRQRFRSLDLSHTALPTTLPSPSQTSLPRQSNGSTGLQSHAQDVAGTFFAMPGRCHFSMDLTSSRAALLHGGLPLKPGMSAMAQRSAKSANAYQAWAAQNASPDPSASAPIHPHPNAQSSSSLLHAAAAHRSGTPFGPGATAAGRADSPSGRSSPTGPWSNMRSSLDRARDILQGGSQLKSTTKESSSSMLSSESLAPPATMRKSPLAPASCSTPDPNGKRCLDAGSHGFGSPAPSASVPAAPRERHSIDTDSVKQVLSSSQSLGHTGSEDLGKQQEQDSLLEAIRKDAELELEMLDRQATTGSRNISNRPGSPTLYAQDQTPSVAADRHARQEGHEAHRTHSQKETEEEKIEEDTFLDPAPKQQQQLLMTRILLEAGVGRGKVKTVGTVNPHQPDLGAATRSVRPGPALLLRTALPGRTTPAQHDLTGSEFFGSPSHQGSEPLECAWSPAVSPPTSNWHSAPSVGQRPPGTIGGAASTHQSVPFLSHPGNSSRPSPSPSPSSFTFVKPNPVSSLGPNSTAPFEGSPCSPSNAPFNHTLQPSVGSGSGHRSHPLRLQALKLGSNSDQDGSCPNASPQISPKQSPSTSGQLPHLRTNKTRHRASCPTALPPVHPRTPSVLHPLALNDSSIRGQSQHQSLSTAPDRSSQGHDLQDGHEDGAKHSQVHDLQDGHEDGAKHSQGHDLQDGHEDGAKHSQNLGARGLWSKLGAGNNMSSKNLAHTFLSHLQEQAEGSMVEAARSRGRSLNGNEEFGGESACSRDCLSDASHAASLNHWPRLPPQCQGIEVEKDDVNDNEEDDLLTPIERESMSARQQKLWAKARLVMRCLQLKKANPVAFDEKAAQAAEAEARAAADHARKRFQDLSSTVSDTRAERHFRDAVQHMQVNRPYFVSPLASKRSVMSRAAVSKKDNRGWRLEDSIFMKRMRENDAQSVYDTPEVVERQFEIDWSRVSSKVRFRKMIIRQDQGLKDAGELERELNEVHDELQKRFTTIRAAFIYYSSFSGSTGSDNMLSMGLMEFHRFARQCNIADPKTPGIKPSDIDTMFISTNFEEESKTTEADANDDNALVRFELLEIIVRMAIGKFIVPKVLSGVSDSVAHLLDSFIEPNLPAVAKVDTNSFRRSRLYCKEMEIEVVRHWDLLQAMFKLYKAKDRTKLFWIEHWMALLESTNLLGGHTGVDKHCAKVMFAFAQSTVADELRRRQRAISLTFHDFVEALARLAEVISPPSPAELAAMTIPQQQQQQQQQQTEQQASGRSSRQQSLEKSLSACSPTTSGNLDSAEDNTGEGVAGGEEATRQSLTVAAYFKRVQIDPQLRVARAGKVGLGKELHLAAEQRPLAESFSGLMELMLSGLQGAWGGKKESQTAARMQKMAQNISGGIELNG